SEDKYGHRDPDQVRDTERHAVTECRVAGTKSEDWSAACKEGASSKRGERAECDDDRRQPEERYDEAVARAEKCSGDDSGKSGKERVPVMLHDEESDDDAAEGNNRADGEIDVASEKKERHPDCNDADDRRLKPDDPCIVDGQKVWRRGGEICTESNEPEQQGILEQKLFPSQCSQPARSTLRRN